MIDIQNTDISDLLVKLRSRYGMKWLTRITGISEGVLKNYIAGDTEPRWRRGAQIYNIALQNLDDACFVKHG